MVGATRALVARVRNSYRSIRYGCVLCLGTDYAAGGYELDRAIPAYPSGPMDRHLYQVPVGQPFRRREQDASAADV